ncbi:MAG: glycosylphosphatidylinositol specific phospholipase [Acidimicrobiaceae bacterium]|nr:glycosylphosphatidylinositol specific phospholipase [Acidimicrobiaceae bacterium]
MADEVTLGPSEDGGVVLELGGEIGALVLRTAAELLGAEIELEPHTPGVPRTHSAVRQRLVSPERVYAAVYPSLRVGSYTVEGSGQVVAIEGGRVTELVYRPQT